MDKQYNTNLPRRIYSVVIMLLYIGVGAYFIKIFFSESEDRSYWLPSWCYAVFGIISVAYGISRFYRSLKN